MLRRRRRSSGSCLSSAKQCYKLQAMPESKSVANSVAPAKAPRLAILFSRAYRARTVLVAVPWFLMDIATYGVGLFTPIILGAIDISGKEVASSPVTSPTPEEALQSICFCCSVFLSEFGPFHDSGASECRPSVSRGMAFGMLVLMIAVSTVEFSGRRGTYSARVRRIHSVQLVDERRT